MISQPEKKGDEPVAFRSVTLLATPSETEAIELAAVTGRPRLVLRSGTDKDITTTAGVTASNLRGRQAARKVEQPTKSTQTVVYMPAPAAAPTPVPTYSSVRVIRGTVESEVRFDNDWFDPKATARTTPTTQPANSTNNVTKTDTNTVSGSDTAPVSGDR
jgi:hypothetical protein